MRKIKLILCCLNESKTILINYSNTKYINQFNNHPSKCSTYNDFGRNITNIILTTYVDKVYQTSSVNNTRILSSKNILQVSQRIK